jgi:5-methylcytosine-specific restriction endonuclease McrA
MAKNHPLDVKPETRFFSRAQSDFLLDFYGYACAACGCDDSAILEIDHWIPHDGNNTVIDNGVVLCRACNGAKHDSRINSSRLPPRKPIDSDSHRVYRVRESANRAAFAEWVKIYGVKGKATIEKKKSKFVAPW